MSEGRERPRRYGRWRAGTLALVYVLVAAHIVHWKMAGRTLAPLELNEVMYTFELGIVTAGFLFMAAAVLSAAVFGRFFCSWGCHILALEDLCAWLLERIGVRPRPVRLRVLLLVPVGAMFYMFLWPHIARFAAADGLRPAFAWRLASDADGWASFVTADFWRNLPGPGVTVLTFFVCGFAIVYLLGSRSFCTYACPYGTIFALADRAAPGRILLRGECTECGLCTAKCQSGIQVEEEVTRFGKVVSARCLKDLDCVGVCPPRALAFGFARPAGFRSLFSRNRPPTRYDASAPEEGLLAITFLATLLIFRGLYSLVPFLLALGLGVVLAWVAVLSVRLVRRGTVRVNDGALKSAGRLTARGRAFAAGALVLLALVAHSAFIRYHEYEGVRAFERIRDRTTADSAGLSEMVGTARSHLRAQERWGLVRAPDLDSGLASLAAFTGEWAEAERYLRRILDRHPDDTAARRELARVVAAQGSVAGGT